MESPSDGTARRDQGRRLHRGLVALAGLFAVAAIAIPLAVHTGNEDEVDTSPTRSTEQSHSVDLPTPSELSPAAEATDGDTAVRFARFPLDQGWEEIYGRKFIDGPGPGAGGISMPEGHCNDEVLFVSGYQDKLSTYVATSDSSRTREILGYANPSAARSTFRALVDAVATCAVFNDSYSDKVAYSATVYEAIDTANARARVKTFTFAYTSTGSDSFGVLYQFAVVGDVVYGSNAYGDWTTETASEGVVALHEENASLIQLMSRIKR